MTTTQSLCVRRIVRAERARVFNAFASAHALSQWFSPAADVSVDVEAFAFVPSGNYRLRFVMPDGTQLVVGGTYELIDPPDRIAFSWVWRPPHPHADVPTRVEVRFTETDGGTEIVITHDRLTSEDAREHHAAGWEGILQRLEHFVDHSDFHKSEEASE